MYKLYIDEVLVHESASLQVLNQFARNYLIINELSNVSVEISDCTKPTKFNVIDLARKMGMAGLEK